MTGEHDSSTEGRFTRRRLLQAGAASSGLVVASRLGLVDLGGLARANPDSPYVGEIRMFAGNFAPAGWLLCEGQLLSIGENEALFQLIGTTYGGDGQTTFALPDLRGRLPIHQGNGLVLAERGGVETVTLTTNQLPAHTHPLHASAGNASAASAQGNVLAQTPTYTPYIAAAPNVQLHGSSISPTGGSQPHDNYQPYLCVNFIISLFGIFPSQTVAATSTGKKKGK
jgi:microcystin-dependent protein